MTEVDRRAHYRLPIRVPIFIKGIDQQGDQFLELTHTVNVSASGACFLCERDLKVASDLMISIPAPVDIGSSESEDYEFKFPARIVRIEDAIKPVKKKISVRFTKLLYG
jgi:hypothetical protein